MLARSGAGLWFRGLDLECGGSAEARWGPDGPSGWEKKRMDGGAVGKGFFHPARHAGGGGRHVADGKLQLSGHVAAGRSPVRRPGRHR